MAAQEEYTFFFENQYVNIETINEKQILTFNDSNEKNDVLMASLYENELPLKRESDNVLELKVNSIKTLKQLILTNQGVLTYNHVLNMMIHIGKQCIFFVNNGYSIPYIDMDNIIVLNSNTFVLLDADLIKINPDTSIDIDVPYDKSSFLGYDLETIHKIPSKIHNSNWVYSLALVAIFCLTGTKPTKSSKYEDIIEYIQDTKLYFMILRCLKKNHNERRYLYI
tara:strand:- start:10218 stop:10889 length:672 start_codon:yes stop_codon:yes gene_type:complete